MRSTQRILNHVHVKLFPSSNVIVGTKDHHSFRRILRRENVIVINSRSTTSKATKTVTNYFSILGIEQTIFSIDSDDLKTTYKTLMTKLHPDKLNQNNSPIEKQNDISASDVTHAYQIIKNPLFRACHILELKGMPIGEKDTGNLVGMEFLMDIMEFRETVGK